MSINNGHVTDCSYLSTRRVGAIEPTVAGGEVDSSVFPLSVIDHSLQVDIIANHVCAINHDQEAFRRLTAHVFSGNVISRRFLTAIQDSSAAPWTNGHVLFHTVFLDCKRGSQVFDYSLAMGVTICHGFGESVINSSAFIVGSGLRAFLCYRKFANQCYSVT